MHVPLYLFQPFYNPAFDLHVLLLEFLYLLDQCLVLCSHVNLLFIQPASSLQLLYKMSELFPPVLQIVVVRIIRYHIINVVDLVLHHLNLFVQLFDVFVNGFY